jgi:hypothetical protein
MTTRLSRLRYLRYEVALQMGNPQVVFLAAILLFISLPLVSMLFDYMGLTKRPKVDYLGTAARHAVEQNHQDVIRWNK